MGDLFRVLVLKPEEFTWSLPPETHRSGLRFVTVLMDPWWAGSYCTTWLSKVLSAFSPWDALNTNISVWVNISKCFWPMICGCLSFCRSAVKPGWKLTEKILKKIRRPPHKYSVLSWECSGIDVYTCFIHLLKIKWFHCRYTTDTNLLTGGQCRPNWRASWCFSQLEYFHQSYELCSVLSGSRGRYRDVWTVFLPVQVRPLAKLAL